MLKIENTEFLKALQSLDQFSIEDFNNRFYTDIDKLDNATSYVLRRATHARIFDRAGINFDCRIKRSE